MHYRKSSIKPAEGPIYFKPIEEGGGGLIETGGVFNLKMTMVSVLHKELDCKVERLKYKKLLGHAAEDQHQHRSSSW